MADNVNHPAHYTDGKYETIEFIERNLFDYCDGNAIKYISRAGKKDPDKLIEDLEKALWYINRADHKLNYNEHAITVHDYILDKKLSPALASVVSLIEVSQYEEAYEMLKAEIERLKKEEKERKDYINIKADNICLDGYMFIHKPECPTYTGKVICVMSHMPKYFTVGSIYSVKENEISYNGHNVARYSTPFYSINDVNNVVGIAEFIEYTGEA